MPNPKKAEVPVTLGDGVKILRFDMNAMAELEEAFKKPVHIFLKEMGGMMGVSVMRTILFQGLQANHADEFTDLRSVGDLMSFDNISEHGEAIGRALSLAVTGKEPEREGAKEADPLPGDKKTEAPGTGADI